jgi:hypothetical protein
MQHHCQLAGTMKVRKTRLTFPSAGCRKITWPSKRTCSPWRVTTDFPRWWVTSGWSVRRILAQWVVFHGTASFCAVFPAAVGVVSIFPDPMCKLVMVIEWHSESLDWPDIGVLQPEFGILRSRPCSGCSSQYPRTISPPRTQVLTIGLYQYLPVVMCFIMSCREKVLQESLLGAWRLL